MVKDSLKLHAGALCHCLLNPFVSIKCCLQQVFTGLTQFIRTWRIRSFIQSKVFLIQIFNPTFFLIQIFNPIFSLIQRILNALSITNPTVDKKCIDVCLHELRLSSDYNGEAT